MIRDRVWEKVSQKRVVGGGDNLLRRRRGQIGGEMRPRGAADGIMGDSNHQSENPASSCED
jgi:hypothetical protein